MKARNLVIPTIGLLLSCAAWWWPLSSQGALPKEKFDRSGYLGSDTCGQCHEGKHSEWSQSLHSKMIQPVGPKSVLGRFDAEMTHQGVRFRMTREDGDYWVTEQNPDQPPIRFKISYTLGSKRIQHYLSTQADGRMRVVFPTWDVRAKKWFHSSAIIPTGHHAETSIQYWNQHCYNCHVSQEDQGFDIDSNSYKTTFTETGINCETCHGPGRVHVERMRNDPQTLDFGILHPGSLPAKEQMMICVQCHMPRVIVQHGFHPGRNYYDYYMPTLMHFYIERWYDPPIWPDGRMRRFATEGAALWQSQCFLKGEATCITCHNPHLNTIKRDARFRDTDVLCTQCHGDLRQEQKVAEHTHHPLGSTGSQCIGCHMPLETNMMNDQERDHSISIPVPENTAKYKIPNACTTCHRDQSPSWAIARMDEWFPGRKKGNARRADAFIAAQKRDPQSIGPLLELLSDPGENVVIRGSAAGFLGEFQSTEAARGLVAALADPEPMVRAEAARSLSEVQTPQALEPLKKALGDKARIVRLNAVFALMKMGHLKMEGPNSQAFQRAKGELERFFTDFPDVQDIRMSLATYHALHGRYLVALQEYKNALKLQPESRHAPAIHYYLGITYAQVGLLPQAAQHLEKTLALSPDFRNTQDLLRQVKEAQR